MVDLMENNYMRNYVEQRRNQDREEFLDSKINAVKPIFKNFQDNNTNILRTELGRGRLHALRLKEKEEAAIADHVGHRCFNQEALDNGKPIKAV